jgi:uncharacterized C2H2 Zn-finger protein
MAFKCAICGKLFDKPYSLILHCNNSHKGEMFPEPKNSVKEAFEAHFGED